jgi:hypothetical protein
MELALIAIGLVLVIAAVRGQSSTLFSLVQSDFTGTDNFIYWLAAMFIVGAIGYIPKARPISTALLALVVIVLFLKNGGTTGTASGFFAQFTSALSSTQTATPSSTSSSTSTSSNPLSGALSSLNSTINSITGGSASSSAGNSLSIPMPSLGTIQ